MPNLNDPIPKGPHPAGEFDGTRMEHPEDIEERNLDQDNLNPDEEETKPEDFEKFDVDKVDQLKKEKESYRDSE